MAEKKFKYRLGLDLGTNSIGWCMLRLIRITNQLQLLNQVLEYSMMEEMKKQKSLWQLSAEMPAVLEEILIEKYPAEIIC